jgi:sugar phosphate permease
VNGCRHKRSELTVLTLLAGFGLSTHAQIRESGLSGSAESLQQAIGKWVVNPKKEGLMSMGERTIQKVRRRIIPFVFLLYFVCFLDRINIGFAALTMNRDLGITSQQFGFVIGIFFFGYFLFEIPSNLLLHRIGARVWMARILIAWGAVAALTGFVRSVPELYAARFLLGLAEAGYFPGMVLYLTYWLPQREQARAVALLITGSPLVNIIGGPISGLILDHVHWLGLAGWRWLLILEGFPAVVFGLLTYFVLPNGPLQVKFLGSEEKAWLQAELQREEQEKRGLRQHSVLHDLASGRLWHLATAYFGLMIGVYALNFWAPQLVKSLSSLYSNVVVGFLVMIPNLGGLAAMILVSRDSDRTLERRFHVAIPAVIAAAALALLGATRSPLASLILLSFVSAGVCSYTAPFWTLPNQFLTGYSAAAGIALINSVGNLGGFAGSYVIGLVATRTGSLHAGLAIAALALLASGVLTLLVPTERRTPHRAAVAFASSDSIRRELA